jgi:hypothetical protein
VSAGAALRPRWLPQPNLAEHKTNGTTGQIFGRGPSKDHSTKVWLQFAQWFLKRRYLCEFPIRFYVQLSSAGRNLKKNLLLWNYWANLNQTLLRWSLGGPLPKLNPAFQTSDPDGRHCQFAQWFLKRRYLCEFPIRFYVQLSSAVGAILVEGPHQRTHFWNRTIQWLFQNLKKTFSSETTQPISTKLWWNDLWVVSFQNCVRHFRPPTKMAATAELNLT